MVNVSTPLTFERYTGNWQGSFEGLPSGVMTTQRLIQNLCKLDKQKFHTTIT